MNTVQHTRAGLAAAFVLLALFGPARSFAQGGSARDRDLVAQLGAFQPEPLLGQRPSSVDLRAWLPPIGSQSMNDCAAWAFGYYAKSYLEARSQGWKPDAPWTIFSPTFIYNQVNHGQDEGSNPIEVLELLANVGAATLSTAPYKAKDFLTPPTAKGLEEAPSFRNAGSFWLTNGEELRAALARGHIVNVGVRTNPVLSSGRYEVYTRSEHERGIQQRRPGQPHGYQP